MTLKELFTYRVFTVSNFLSLSRVFLLIPFWYVLYNEEEYHSASIEALIIVMAMVLTDFLDGYLARFLGQETPLGQYLDPIADKITILGALFLMHLKRGYPMWIFIVILLREVYGSFFGMFLLTRRNVMGKPSYWGKTGVVLIAASGVFYLMDWQWKQWTNVPVAFTLAGGVIAYGLRYGKTIFKTEPD